MNAIEFEEWIWTRRREQYRHPNIDIINEGFRPVGGKVADFCVIEHEDRFHFFYIERRLVDGLPGYPGHECFFGHASTADLVNWEVHDPVLWVRPGTWEHLHVFAPSILRHGDEFVMAYTGVNADMSQNIGLARSTDLLTWQRNASNPLSPSKDRSWSFWREHGPAACRDPHLLWHDGRVWMTYTAYTRGGASCIALASSVDLATWQDHGPILVGPEQGYEPVVSGGHPQGHLESSYLMKREERWLLVVNAAIKEESGETKRGNWLFESERMDRFAFAGRRLFWGAYTMEVVMDRGPRSLLACAGRPEKQGCILFGEVDWSEERPAARFVSSTEELARWLE